MVFTHLPSNVLLLLVRLIPSHCAGRHCGVSHLSHAPHPLLLPCCAGCAHRHMIASACGCMLAAHRCVCVSVSLSLLCCDPGSSDAERGQRGRHAAAALQHLAGSADATLPSRYLKRGLCALRFSSRVQLCLRARAAASIPHKTSSCSFARTHHPLTLSLIHSFLLCVPAPDGRAGAAELRGCCGGSG